MNLINIQELLRGAKEKQKFEIRKRIIKISYKIEDACVAQDDIKDETYFLQQLSRLNRQLKNEIIKYIKEKEL